LNPSAASPIPPKLPIKPEVKWPQRRQILPFLPHLYQTLLHQRPGIPPPTRRRLRRHASDPSARAPILSEEHPEIHHPQRRLQPPALEYPPQILLLPVGRLLLRNRLPALKRLAQNMLHRRQIIFR